MQQSNVASIAEMSGINSSERPDIDLAHYNSILDVLKESCKKFHNKPAFSNLGHTISYSELYQLSGQFASWIQHHTDLQPGDRIAVQLPNLMQYPVVVFGAMRAGLVIVNTNPLYTEREMEHQFNDSGAKALVVLSNMASAAEKVLPKTGIKHVIVTHVGDMLPMVKRTLVNSVIRYVKKMVPQYHLPQAISFRETLKKGRQQACNNVDKTQDDLAVLQYTGGTTGVSKGAMLSHRNLLSNMLQAKDIMTAALNEGEELMVCPLPLYHVYAFTFHCMVGMIGGQHNLLITNPRDLDGMVKELRGKPFSVFVGLNTLFVGLMNHTEFRNLDFSSLKLTASGGMALQHDTAARWESLTGCKVVEGYGMSETSPMVTANPPSQPRIGSIGVPVPSTSLRLVDDNGNEPLKGEAGELWVKGPQVMDGYWNMPEESANVLTEDGWLKTGDIAVFEDDGFVRLVDRKKDMIVVSGFNVYPNELEDVLADHPDISQSAAIGIPSDKTGEAIKIFAVRTNPELEKEEVIAFIRKKVTGYKVPKIVEFRDELPTTNVGKILRRKLREEELEKRSRITIGAQ
ncbi:AMP-binding protein [Spongorhabdus nitratireducens]